MHRLIVLTTLALGCTPIGDSDTNATTTATTEPGTTAASTTDASTTDTPTTTDASTGTSDATTTTPTTGDDTTGEAAWCHGWDGADGEPRLALFNSDGELLTDGGTLGLECGGQGLFMFGLYPQFGGFVHASDAINFEYVVDVEGHNTNPDGHFASTAQYGYYIGCEDPLGGQLGVVAVFPPDNEDPLLLDGLAATLHVVMETDSDTVTIDLQVTLAVDAGGDFQFCGQG